MNRKCADKYLPGTDIVRIIVNEPEKVMQSFDDEYEEVNRLYGTGAYEQVLEKLVVVLENDGQPIAINN